MTAAGAAGKPLGRFGEFARLVSHYKWWIVIGVFAADFIGGFVPPPWGTWVITVGWLPVLLFFTAMYGDSLHATHWDCPLCVERTPILYGEEEAVRLRRRLWFTHTRKAILLGVALPLLLYIVSPVLVPAPWYKLLTLPWFAGFVYMCLCSETHRNLLRWCPWCRGRWDNKEPHEIAPVPPPVGVKEE